MKIHLDCIPCFISQALQASRFATADEGKQEEILREVLAVIDRNDWSATASEMAVRVHYTVMNMLGEVDPYREEKERSNAVVLDMYDRLKQDVESDADPLARALKLAIAGNIMDYGAKREFDIHDTIRHLTGTPFSIDHSRDLKRDLDAAESIAILADNAGEIVFDRLFMETVDKSCGRKEWHLFIKAKPIINDATREDVSQIGLDILENITIHEVELNRDFDERTEEAFATRLGPYDFAISKGQGNYEALSGMRGVNLYFLLMAKCRLVARDIGVECDDFIVLHRPKKNR